MIADTRGCRLMWLCGALLAVVALWNAREVLAFDFVARDDDINIYYNPHLGPPAQQSLTWMFTDFAYMRRYIPFGWLAFSSVYQFSGLSPIGYHGANLALHVVNSLLVYGLLFMSLRRFAAHLEITRRVATAALGAAMWALHPLRAETIGWASGLLYGAAGFWALVSALAYVLADGAPSARGKRMRWLGVSWVSYAASILTYPMSIALPIAFVSMDFAHQPKGGQRPGLRQLLVEKLGFVFTGAAVLGCTLVARFETSAFWPPPPTWQDFTLLQRIVQAMAVWAHYLWCMAWPVNLTPAPTWLFNVNPLALPFVASSIVITGISILLLRRRAWRGALLIWITYLGILVPLLGLTERPHFASDRYGYLAGVVVIFAVTLALTSLRGTSHRIARELKG